MMLGVLMTVFVISIKDKAIQAIFIDKPRNIIVTEGTTIQLNCATNDTTGMLRWFHRIKPSSEETMIYSGKQISTINNSQMYSVDKSIPGRCHLILNNTTSSSAGTYTCNEFKSRMNASAQVIVMASRGPFCNSSLKNMNVSRLTDPNKCSVLTLSCIIPKQVTLAPTENIGNHTVIIQYIHGSTRKDYIVIPSNSTDGPPLNCSVDRTDKVSTSSEGLYKFHCRVTYGEFRMRTPTNASATNIPDYYFYLETNSSTIWRQDDASYLICSKIDNQTNSYSSTEGSSVSINGPTTTPTNPILLQAVIITGCLLGVVSIFVVVLLVKQLRKGLPNRKLMEPDVQTLPSNSSHQSEELTSIDDMETAFSSGGSEVAASGDGTEYVDTGGLTVHRQVSANKLKLHSDTYASIDHTGAPEKPTQPLRSLDEFGGRKRTTRF